MVKLKDILLETKFGYLVEAPTKKKEKTGNPVLDKEYKLTSKATGKEIPKTGKEIRDMGAKQGKLYKNYPQVIKQINKNLDKQEKDKAQKKSEEDKINKIKNTDVKALDKKSGKKISVKVDKVLKPPFGSAKEIDDSVPGTKEAKKVVYDAKVAEAQEEATKEAETRKKKNKGKFKLTAEEQKEFNAWKEENEYFIDDDFTEEEWFTKQRPKEEMSVFNPEDGEQWEEDFDDYLGDEGEFDDGWGETDKFGNETADELGDEKQVEAMATKLDLPKETFIPATKETKVIKNKHGQNVAIKIFRNNQDGQYYAVDDEGNVYKTKPGGKIDLDSDESIRDSFEYKTNLDGYPGAKTSKGVERGEDRTPDTDWDDMGDSVSFAELLDMLGLEDEEGF